MRLVAFDRLKIRTNVSVPLPGFSGLRHVLNPDGVTSIGVSVPLPGFSGLRQFGVAVPQLASSFSPVAGIQWVETWNEELLEE